MPSPRCCTQKSSPLIPSGSGCGSHELAKNSVGDIPLPDLPFEVTNLVGDVLVQQVAELGVADRSVADAGGEPVGQLVVPDERVSADELVVLPGEADQAVAAGPV